MPTLPDISSLQRIIPTGQAPIATVDTRGIGSGLEAIGSGLAKIAETKSRYQVSKAEADTSIALADLETRIKNDPNFDYDTVDEETSKIISGSAANISLPMARNSFSDAQRVQAARVKAKAEEVRLTRWRDEEQARIQETLDKSADAAIVTGDIAGSIATSDALLTNAVDAGVFGMQGATIRQEALSKFKDRVAEGHIRTLPPEKQLAALKQESVKNNMDPVTYARMVQEAEQNEFRYKALSESDRIIDEISAGTLDAEDVDYRLRDYKDNPRLRLAVEDRVKTQLGYAEERKKLMREEILSEYYTGMYEQETTLDDILADPEERKRYEALSPSQQSSLMSMQSSMASNAMASDPELMIKLTEAAGNKDFDGMFSLLSATTRTNEDGEEVRVNPKLRPKDHLAFLKIATEGRTKSIEDAGKVFLEVNKVVSEVAKSESLKKASLGRFNSYMQDWVNDYIDKNTPEGGTPVVPTEAEIRERAKQEILKGDSWITPKRIYEMDLPQSRRQMFRSLDVSDSPNNLAAIKLIMARRGKNFDPENIEHVKAMAYMFSELDDEALEEAQKELKSILRNEQVSDKPVGRMPTLDQLNAL